MYEHISRYRRFIYDRCRDIRKNEKKKIGIIMIWQKYSNFILLYTINDIKKECFYPYEDIFTNFKGIHHILWTFFFKIKNIFNDLFNIVFVQFVIYNHLNRDFDNLQ